MTIKTFRAVTILNELGVRQIGAQETENVKSISATVYDASGSEIKKLRRKDFREVSLSEGSEITDAKMTYLDYTPVSYPFTIVYESEVSTPNTAFIPAWYSIQSPFQSIEKSEVLVSYLPALGFRYKEYNFDGRSIAKKESANSIHYIAENLSALKSEQYSPSLDKLVPYVLFGLERFNLEGVEGEATSWESFSAWNYNNLLAGTDELPETTQAKVKMLVGDEKDPIKKAKIIYQYVQDKTRYVSIQLGIGGWKPMKAKDVDRLGYGDCKALSNYTRSLLNVVGVESYYTVVYADGDKKDLRDDFVSMQGNHVILAIPDGDSYRWMECTSQTAPFDFQSVWTDDRLALLIKPKGGALVRTNIYPDAANSQSTKGNYLIGGDGVISGKLEIRSKGSQYKYRMDLAKKSADDLTTHYRNYFSGINNLQLAKTEVVNDKPNTECKEALELSAIGYATPTGNRLIFAVNAFNQFRGVPQRYRNRTNPIERERGFFDQDDIVITIPDGYVIEAKPESVTIEEVYGTYKAEVELVDAKHIRYKRSLLMKSGVFPASDYDKFRKFNEQVSRADNAKCVLVKL